MTRLLALVLTAISLLVPTTAGAQRITPVSIKLDPGGTVTVPFQSPGLNMVTGAVVTVGDRTPVGDVTARIVHQSPTSLSVIVSAAPTARPRPDYQVWLQTTASKTPVHVATVQVVARATAPGGPAYQPERQVPRAEQERLRGQPVPPPPQTPPPPPTLESLTPAAPTVIGGLPLRVDVRLTGPVSTPAVVVLQYTANFGGVSMPQSVTVPAGQASASFEVTAGFGRSETLNFSLRALYGGVQKDATVTVLPDVVRLLQVTVDAPSVPGGQRLRGRVVLNAPAVHAATVMLSVTQSSPVGTTPSAQVPATVTIPIGQTSVPFDITTVTVVSRAQLTLFAYYLGGRQGATFTVDPVAAQGTQPSQPSTQPPQTSPPPQTTQPPETTQPPPALALVSVGVASARVGGASIVNGTLTLNTVAPAGGTRVTLASDNPTVASVPTGRTIPAGQSSVGFQISTHIAAADTAVTVSATLGATTRTTILTVGPPRLTRVAAIYRDQVHDLWGVLVELDGPAPAGGAVVALTSQNTAAARVPATLAVPQGQTSWSAPIDFTRSTSMVAVTLTGVYGGVTKTGVVGVLPLPPPPVVSSISPMSGSTGFSICGTNLGGFVKFGSRILPSSLATSGPSSLTYLGACPRTGDIRESYATPTDLTPGSYTISIETAGGTWTSAQPFTLTAPGTTGQQNPSAPSQQSGAAALASITVNPTQVGGGTTVYGTIALSTVAPAGGAQVTLASDKPNVAFIASPPRTIPAGQSSVGFEFGTVPVVADTVVTVSATLGGTTKTATLTVGPPRLSRVSSSYRDQVHDTWNVFAELDGPAPAGGAVVTLTSDNIAAARVPATVTVPQHQTRGYAGIDFTRGTSPVTVTLTGVYGGVTKTGVVGVWPLPPPPVVSSVSPMSGPPRGLFVMCGTNLSAYIKLGSRSLGARTAGGWGCPSGENRQEFEVPGDLTPGSYTMSMDTAGGTWTSPQNFSVTAP